MDEFERELWGNGCQAVAGIDEAGRGPLAGPVVAAAVVFDPERKVHPGINDSKKLSPETREFLFDRIYADARAVGLGIVYQDEIDSINILQATLKAMKSAAGQLAVTPSHLLVDGITAPDTGRPCTTIIKGDSLSVSIAAASIIAKVTRDRIMTMLDPEYPHYGFKRNKGYATAYHINAIRERGISQQHRVTFCRKILDHQMAVTF